MTSARSGLRAISPRQASFWLLDIAKPRDSVECLSQQAFVRQLGERVPAISPGWELGTAFIRLIRQRQAAELPAWLERAEQSTLAEFIGFAQSLRQDYDAVQATFQLPWSQGQVEGQVNRLKFIKRSMSGRAGFDLFKRRVLTAA